MKKAIIFGCGNIGTGSFWKIKENYEVIAWTDNNEMLWGKYKEGLPIISPLEMCECIKTNVDIIVFVSVIKSTDIVKQLREYEISNYYVWKEGFFFYNEEKGFLTYKYNNVDYRIRDNSVLFVMNTIVGGIREYRLASILKEDGYNIYLAYFSPFNTKLGEGFIDVYEQIIPIMSLDELVELSNNKNFVFIHSSSEPEWGTAFLKDYNNKIIHECHDLGSSNINMTMEDLTMEYISNVAAQGVIYPTEALRKEAVSKFNIPIEKTIVIENIISECLIPTKRLQKLSDFDGKVHAVYEGAITANNEYDKRYFEKIWLRIAEEGIVVHFYTNHEESYCKYLDELHPNIIYEGNLSSMELAVEMTKYDLGLLLFNVNKRNKRYLENASPNKMYEYLNAGIPVATNGIDSYKEFVEKYHVGKEISLEGGLLSQFKELKTIPIESDFLTKNGYTIESHKEEIIKFIDKVISGGKNEKKNSAVWRR